MYQRQYKTATVTITPYKYYSPLAGVFEEITVYIIKGSESPDPWKKLFWGYNKNGDMIKGDFKKYFTKAGKPVTLTYDITNCYTHNEEISARSRAIKEYLKALTEA